jgi:hypothetical protein
VNEVSRRVVRFCRAGAGLLVCVAAGALVSIAVANTHSGAASAAYYYQYCTNGAGSEYQYCSTSTSTSTSTSVSTTTSTTTSTSTSTSTTTPTETKPGKGCGDKNHLHERRFECRVVIADATIKEGKLGSLTSLFLTVELSGSPESVVTVNYATAPGTATSGVDYRPISGTLSFPGGVSSKKLTVTVIGDKTREPNETFFVNLSNPSPNAYLGDAQGLGTIGNDD